MLAKGWVAANDGNIAWRISETRSSAPQGVIKGMLAPSHICSIDMDVRCRPQRRWKPSSEIKCTFGYSGSSDVRSVFHAHPPYATAPRDPVYSLSNASFLKLSWALALSVAPYTEHLRPARSPDRLAPDQESRCLASGKSNGGSLPGRIPTRRFSEWRRVELLQR